MKIKGLLRRLDQRLGDKLSFAMTIQPVFFYALILTACSTVSKERPEFNKPYGVVRSAVQHNMPRGIRTTSRNGRTYISEYFLLGNWDEDGTEARERGFAKATILNSSRPYQVEAAIYRQHMISKGEYSDAQIDEQASERLIKKISDDIANRREDRNIIDDFKPF